MAKTKKAGSNYGEKSIKTLSAAEGIRKRYGMYIGTAGKEGVKRLFYEALGNAIDEFNAKRCSKIDIIIDGKESRFTVTDNGIGLPQNKIEEVCTKLHSGGKFEDEYSLFSIGMNGVGLTVINALSTELIMTVRRDGYEWTQSFSKGDATSKLKKVRKLTAKEGTGTTVSFIPDVSVMRDIDLDIEDYMNFIQLSSYMNKGLILNCVGIDKKGKKTEKKFNSKNGLVDYIKTIDDKQLFAKPIVLSDKNEYEDRIEYTERGEKIVDTRILNEEAEIIISFSKNDTQTIKSYCNGLETIEGGSHNTGTQMGLTEVLSKAVKNSGLLTKKDGDIEIIKEDIQEGIICLINVKHSEPVFKSQTKDKLDVNEVQWFCKKIIVKQLTDWLKSNPKQAKLIYQRIIASAKGRLAANRAKNAKKKQAAGLIGGLSSLSKITLATGKDPSKKRMFIVEGDSAGGGAIDARCPETDSIAKLRGKPLNTHGVAVQKIEDNTEFDDITTALGCGIDGQFDISKLTHDMIIIMTDADIDGSHIAALLCTFFFDHMRPLFEEGHIYIAQAPLYKIEENGKFIFFKDKFEFNAYLAKKILTKYSVGRVVSKNGKKVLKPFSEKEFVNFLNITDHYNVTIKNLADDRYMRTDLLELIINTSDKKKISQVVTKKYKELKVTNKKNGDIKIEGMIDDQCHDVTLDGDFFEKISEVRNFIKENKYVNMYYKEDGKKSKRSFISEILDVTLKYGMPKHRQRFKGLGEMDYDELWVTTMNPEADGITQIKPKDVHELEEIIETQFGNDADKRKDFLYNFTISPDDIDN